MKCTPQKAITSAPVCRGLLGEAERVADVVGHVLDLGQLVVVGQDDGVARPREVADLVLQGEGVLELERAGFMGSGFQCEGEVERRGRMGQPPERDEV